MELADGGDDVFCGLQLVVCASQLGFSCSISPEQPLPLPVLLCDLGPTAISEEGGCHSSALQCRHGTSGLQWQSVHPPPHRGLSLVPPCWQGFSSCPLPLV